MLFHITYEFSPDCQDEANARFMETGAMPPDGVEMLGRWHSVEGQRGFMIAESSDAVAIAKWTREWTDLLTFEVVPVITDDQVQQILS